MHASRLTDCHNRSLQLRYILVVYGISLLFWLSTLAYRTYTDREIDRLNEPLFTMQCDGWCALHFVSYAALGFLAPSYWHVLIVAGFLFELVELGLSLVVKFVKYNLVGDTLTNAGGIVLGVFLRLVLLRSTV